MTNVFAASIFHCVVAISSFFFFSPSPHHFQHLFSGLIGCSCCCCYCWRYCPSKSSGTLVVIVGDGDGDGDDDDGDGDCSWLACGH